MAGLMSSNIFAKIANNKFFQNSIILVILLTALLVGLETYNGLYEPHKTTFETIDHVIQAIFTIEIAIRILAYGRYPYRFFKNGSNVIDFLITAIFYLPLGGAYASVFRLLRIIRIFRLITVLPQLQIIIGALMKTIPSMGWVTLLLLIDMYIFAVLGSVLFGKNDPEHFGDLGLSLLTLFQVITLEGWVDVMKNQGGGFVPPLYFISFILIGTMIILNLFIGVVTSGFDEVKKEIESDLDKTTKSPPVKKELIQISEQLDLLRKRMDVLINAEKKKRS
jgi:voltage-gated sodium channel